ncbi:MAG: hypothetical protein Terrestrivirus2_10 [Terrestrivirus sp.]|uniref:Uncharacterized protein n=1 Tax=Terrestrivirus sp. TaxID=2487775 RepID=A0A3G4ZKZ0_9VIRU|nr:MAG: hypothetical protein Terrestrivirus2_10 [Terrestrivirus sp.]
MNYVKYTLKGLYFSGDYNGRPSVSNLDINESGDITGFNLQVMTNYVDSTNEDENLANKRYGRLYELYNVTNDENNKLKFNEQFFISFINLCIFQDVDKNNFIFSRSHKKKWSNIVDFFNYMYENIDEETNEFSIILGRAEPFHKYFPDDNNPNQNTIPTYYEPSYFKNKSDYVNGSLSKYKDENDYYEKYHDYDVIYKYESHLRFVNINEKIFSTIYSGYHADCNIPKKCYGCAKYKDKYFCIIEENNEIQEDNYNKVNVYDYIEKNDNDDNNVPIINLDLTFNKKIISKSESKTPNKKTRDKIKKLEQIYCQSKKYMLNIESDLSKYLINIYQVTEKNTNQCSYE